MMYSPILRKRNCTGEGWNGSFGDLFTGTFTKIYQFSNGKQRKFLDLYFRRYEIIFIKNCLNRIMDYGSARLAMTGFEDFFRKHSKLDLEKLMNSSTLDEFVANLEREATFIRR